MTISDKIFSYIDVAKDLTSEMIQEYTNSLIFIGDEQQIYHPLTGAYVGIGMSNFNEVKDQIQNTTNMLRHLDTHIHQNVVNSIFAEYSLEQFDSVFGTDSSLPPKKIAGNNLSSGQGTYLMTNQDIVVKGLYDYDPNTKRARTNDAIGWPYDNVVNTQLWAHINRGAVGHQYGSSGIQVNVHHTGELKEGLDEYQFKYSYFENQDYITIDDSLTWSYITEKTSYLMTFAKKIAVDQANRVYHDILGGNDPVYIEKEFNEVFDTNIYGDLVQIIEGDKGEVYIHAKGTSGNEDVGEFKKVYVYNDDSLGKYYIYCPFYNQTTDQIDYYIINTNDTANPASVAASDDEGNPITLTNLSESALINILFPDDGYDKDDDGNFTAVTWYHVDWDATAQGQLNLADGIQTIKEVSYILDRITDGEDDDIITLTYNIASNAKDIAYFKKWQENIGDFVPTSIEGLTTSNYVVVNSYSADNWGALDKPAKGDAKLEIDLILAQTYTLNGSSYAAYLNTEHTPLVNTVWKCYGDITNEDYYIDMRTLTGQARIDFANNLIEVFGHGTSIQRYTKYDNDVKGNPVYVFTDTIDVDDVATAVFNDSPYILFNYQKVENPRINGLIEGLTTVNWVTTYFKWAQVDIFNEVNRLDNEVKDWVLAYINTMNVTDTEPAGQYVSKVDQVNGKIVVTHKMLPLDTILASQEIYGDDFFVEISPNQALEIIGGITSPDFTKVYIFNSSTGQYIHPTMYDSGIKYYLMANATRFTQIDTTGINTSTGPQTLTNKLLTNSGNVSYFQKVSNYKVNNGVTTEDVMNYIPVDINELITNSSTNDYSVDPVTNHVSYFVKKEILQSLYYYNGLNGINKYIEVFNRQNTETGGTEMHITSYVTPIGSATKSNRGLADSYDVRHTIESMFSWIDLKSNKVIHTSADLARYAAESES